MTPPDPQQVAEIAGRLSKAQREAIAKAEFDGKVGRYFSRFIGEREGKALVRLGLGTAVWSGLMLSSSGEAVRNFIQGTHHD